MVPTPGTRPGPDGPSGLSFRSAREDDRVFLWEVHRDAMREEVEKIWGWDEADQLQRFLGGLEIHLVQVIRWQRRDVGFITVSEPSGEIFLRQISILRAYQGQGIGTAVVRLLLDRAKREGKPFGLQVFKNGRALRLYKRLGMVVVGETPEHWRMRWSSLTPPRGGAGRPGR